MSWTPKTHKYPFKAPIGGSGIRQPVKYPETRNLTMTHTRYNSDDGGSGFIEAVVAAEIAESVIDSSSSYDSGSSSDSYGGYDGGGSSFDGGGASGDW